MDRYSKSTGCRPPWDRIRHGNPWVPYNSKFIWVFPKIGVPQNGWFIMENPIKTDDLGVPLFSETSI